MVPTRPIVLLGVFSLLLLVPGALAQGEETECDVHTELLADIQYFMDGELVASGTALQGNVQGSGNLTAVVTVAEGCVAEMSLVAYEIDASGAADVAAAASVDTQVLTEGTHVLSVEVPECMFEVTLAAGAAIEAASNPEVLYQAEGRLVAFATGGIDCALDSLPTLPCPANVSVTAQADGSVLLSFVAATQADLGLGLGATAEATGAAIAILRATPGGTFETVATLSADATSFVDTTVAEGEVYIYSVVMVHGDVVVSLGCPPKEVTTIPDLPTGIAVAAAGILGTGAYALMRRRKA